MPKTGDSETEGHETKPHEHLVGYGGGHIEARHGRVDGWLAVVYVILFVWSIYYGLTHWGGLGPGLDY